MSDKSPLITSAQRDWLKEIVQVDMDDSGERTLRTRVRTRLHGAILDFSFLLDRLPPRDLEAVFSDLNHFRRARQRTAEALGAEGVAVELRSEDEQDGDRLQQGIVDLLAFLYLGIDNRTDFEQWLEDAIERAYRVDNRLPVFATVSIGIDRDTPEQMHKWALEHRIGKQSRTIPGGKWTPQMDPELYEELGIGEMSGEELRDLFDEGVPRGSLWTYDGEDVYIPDRPWINGSSEESDANDC
jgi:hypothetical protein